MRTRLLMMCGALTVAALAGCNQTGSDSERAAAKQASAESAVPPDVKVVGVDAVAQNPQSYAGHVAIEGVVARVSSKREAFTMIDSAEFAQCGETGCAQYNVPVFVSSDEFEGQLPKHEETVLVIGKVEPQEKGYQFIVQEVKRKGQTILSRVREPVTGQVQVVDTLPASLLMMKSQLELTAEQESQLKALQTAYADATTRLQAKLTHCQEELVELLEAAKVDQAKVTHEKEEIAELKEKLSGEVQKRQEEARSVLTDKQLGMLSDSGQGGKGKKEAEMKMEQQIHKTVDTHGEVCPFPWVHAKKAMKKLEVGQVLQVLGDHGPALKNIPRNFTDDGQMVLNAEATGEVDWEILVRKEQ